MLRTYVDSGVLLDAATGNHELARCALHFLDDDRREFVSSHLVWLETVPKAQYHKKTEEADFYLSFFDNVIFFVTDIGALVKPAMELARIKGLSAMDALHVVAARTAEVDEFLTTEKPTKPLFRVEEPRIVYSRSG